MDTTTATLDLIKNQRAELAKAGWQQSGSAVSGITNYDLELGAKKLFPVITPLRDRIPRLSAKGGIQANWRAVTGINTLGVSAGIAPGQRNARTTHTTADYFAAYRTLGMDDSVDFQADWSAEGFDDVKALSVEQLLYSTMIQEEFVDLGGNTSVALGTTPTPTLTTATTGGSFGASTALIVNCVALTLRGYQQLAAWNNGTVGGGVNIATGLLAATISRANADGTTDTLNGGTAQVSANATLTGGTGTTNSFTATVAPVRGAVAYAWFWGTTGSVLLGAVTTINSVSILAAATGSQNVSTMPATDNSTDSLVYDGILTQIMKSGSGAYFSDLANGTAGVGTSLTSDGAGGCVEIDAVLRDRYDLYRISPNEMFMGAGVALALNKLIIANGGAPLIRYGMDANGATITAGTMVGQYLNKITGTLIKVTIHPNMPAGQILFFSDSSPYPMSGVPAPLVKRLRRDYFATEWPLKSYRFEYSTAFDGVLQCYFPPAFGLLRNIAA